MSNQMSIIPPPLPNVISNSIPTNFSVVSAQPIIPPAVAISKPVFPLPVLPKMQKEPQISKKKQKEIDDIMNNLKDKPEKRPDYFAHPQKIKSKPEESSKGLARSAAGKVWKDPTMDEWDPNDYRIFVGNLGYEIVDEHLMKAFSKYSSMQKAKVIRNLRNYRSKGYGFVSFKDPDDFLNALKEMDGNF